jgi:hypothetical protein
MSSSELNRQPPYEEAASKPANDDPLFVGVSEICDTATLLAGVDGAALAILTPSARVRELVYATDFIARQLDELQYTIGEGPCFDAYLANRPQFYPELTSVDQTSRWPTFAANATDLGAHSLFAFPVSDGRRPMGVLELYRRTIGSLTDAERDATARSATAIARKLQSNWRSHVAHFGSAEKAVDAAAVAGAERSEPADPFTRTQIHVAGGIVAVQLGVDAGEGVDRLRAYSFACSRPISAVAADIIARRLTLADQPDVLDG